MIDNTLEFELLEAHRLRGGVPQERPRETHSPAAPSRVGQAPGIAVSLVGVEKRFGERDVLRGLTLDIGAGEFVAIVGRSGCGKSTLLRLMAGLDAPTTGEIALGGHRVDGRAADARLMFQDARLLPWRRVIDNVSVGLDGDRRQAALDALRAVGLDSRARDWPAVLSGGQRQRVALARALVSRPRLLLLDEPLGALDALTRLEMQALVETMWQAQHFTAILVTHDVAEAVALADRVIVLDEGRIAFEIEIDHPRPRRRGSAELAAVEGRLLGRLLHRGLRAV